MGRFGAGIAVAVSLLALGCRSTSTDDSRDQPDAAGPAKSSTLALTSPRAVHQATRLADGSVLFTGGCSEPGCGGFDASRTADVFDPAKQAFMSGATMGTARASGTATLLADDRVLLVGGYPGEGAAPTAHAELFDPASGEFVPVGPLATGRADHSATLLPDGTVLVAGGFDELDGALASTEIFDPERRTFHGGASLSDPRAAHLAVSVGARLVLIGGTRDSIGLATTDVLADGRWSPGPHLKVPRVKMGVARIDPGRVWVVGGATDVEGRHRLASTEILDLASGRVAEGPALLVPQYKLEGAVVELEDGRVAVAGADTVEVFDPRTNALVDVPEPRLGERSFRTATPLDSDEILVAGGYDRDIVPTRQAAIVRVPPR